MRVGIIGGGVAGLSAAYEFVQHGHTPEIFERSPYLGGQASTFMVGGNPVERGYHHLFRSDASIIDLMEELDLGHRLAWIDSNVGYFVNDRIWKFTTPVDLLRFSPLPLTDRIRLGLATLRLQRRKEWHSLEVLTAADWISTQVGVRPYKVIFEPMLRGKFGKYFDQVSMAWLWNKFALRTASRGQGIRGFLKEQLGYPVGSFGEIFEKLQSIILNSGGQVNVGAEVKEVVVEDGRARGLMVTKPGELASVRHDYDMILATVPSFIFPKLAPRIPTEYLDKLNSATYLAAVLSVLVLDRPLSSTYWLYVGDRSVPFLGVIEHTNLIDPVHYGGKHIVYLANYLDKGDRLYNHGEDALLQEYLPHLKRINPEFNESWILEAHYHREEAAQPVVTAGYAKNIPAHRTPIPGLYLANTTQIYPEDRGTNYSVRMGRRVATMMINERS